MMYPGSKTWNVLSACFFAIAAGSGTRVEAENSPRAHPILMELFTSQGCSSCPPADALLEHYVARDDVIALSLPVDYWDRLGWKDTFAKHAFSERQRAYARSQNDGAVYTPQIVIGGKRSVIGSSREQIEDGLKQAKEDDLSCTVRIGANLSQGVLTVSQSIEQSANSQNCVVPADLYLAEVLRTGRVKISRGENAGRDITYHNVVGSLSSVLTWDWNAVTQVIPVQALSEKSDRFHVVILQARSTRHILAAQIIETPQSSPVR